MNVHRKGIVADAGVAAGVAALEIAGVDALIPDYRLKTAGL